MVIDVDALIVGGGAAGLWVRAVLKSYGRSTVLIESDALGAGQTIASQGIIHNGAKYAAEADAGERASVLRVIAFAWRLHLDNENNPELQGTTVHSDQSWYWNPEGPLPKCLDDWWDEYHPVDDGLGTTHPLLRECPAARRNDERSICPESLLNVLAGDDRRDLLLVSQDCIRWQVKEAGEVDAVTLSHSDIDTQLTLRPRVVFFTAGVGNAELRGAVGLTGAESMQRRPLRMGLVRGQMPTICGHWFDDDGPRLTISTQFDDKSRTIWQLGGRVAEGPGATSSRESLTQCRHELSLALPSFDLSQTEWASYDAVRAEPTTLDGRIPSALDGMSLEGNVITLWPTKLTLLPYHMIDLRRMLDREGAMPQRDIDLPDWPRPEVARPPWKTITNWLPDAELARHG